MPSSTASSGPSRRPRSEAHRPRRRWRSRRRSLTTSAICRASSTRGRRPHARASCTRATRGSVTPIGATAPPRLPARGRAEQGAHGDREPQVPRAAKAACAAPQPLVAAARRPVVRRVGRDAVPQRAARRRRPRRGRDGARSSCTLRWPAQEGCLRALAAIHRETRGGLASYGAALPARLRKEIGRGRIREAIDVPRERFEARIERRYRALLARLDRAHARCGRARNASTNAHPWRAADKLLGNCSCVALPRASMPASCICSACPPSMAAPKKNGPAL